MTRDHESDLKGWILDCDVINAGLQKFPGVTGTTKRVDQAGQPTPRVKIPFDPDRPADTAKKMHDFLTNLNPSIVLDFSESLYISPGMLSNGEIALVLVGIERAVNSLSSSFISPHQP